MENDIGTVGDTPGGPNPGAIPFILANYSAQPSFESPPDNAIAEEFSLFVNPFDLDDASVKFASCLDPTSYQVQTFVPRTTVIGLVLAPDNNPVSGISVQVLGTLDSATTQLDGTFEILNARVRPGMVVEASGTLNDQRITGQSEPTDGVVDGITDVGVILTVEVLSALASEIIDPDNDPDFGPHIATPQNCDSIFGPFNLANPVNWFGQPYSQFFVGMNGWVSFTSPFGNVSPFPSTGQFFNTTPWISLNFQDWSPQCQVRTVTYRDSADLFVVTWNRTRRFGCHDPATKLQARIASTDVVDSVATVRLELDNWIGSRYTDMFTLLKVDGEWKIMNKVFHLHS